MKPTCEFILDLETGRECGYATVATCLNTKYTEAWRACSAHAKRAAEMAKHDHTLGTILWDQPLRQGA